MGRFAAIWDKNGTKMGRFGFRHIVDTYRNSVVLGQMGRFIPGSVYAPAQACARASAQAHASAHMRPTPAGNVPNVPNVPNERWPGEVDSRAVPSV